MKGPLFKWFGSKWLASKHYPSPEHDVIYEPYAGSACYASRHATKNVVIWDIDPNLQILWPWLINEATEAIIREIPLEGKPGEDIRKSGISTGQAMLVKHWQRTNSVGDCWTFSPWHGKPGLWCANTRARVAAEVMEVKHWKFQPTSYQDLGTWFIDPPYQYNYQYRSSLDRLDYTALSQAIETIPSSSQVIVCEAACPKTGALPTWLPFRPWRTMITSRRTQGMHSYSNEAIWLRSSKD